MITNLLNCTSPYSPTAFSICLSCLVLLHSSYLHYTYHIFIYLVCYLSPLVDCELPKVRGHITGEFPHLEQGLGHSKCSNICWLNKWMIIRESIRNWLGAQVLEPIVQVHVSYQTKTHNPSKVSIKITSEIWVPPLRILDCL